MFITSIGDFAIVCKGRGDCGSEILYAFNTPEMRRLSLPMPALGWRVAVLTFTAKDNGCWYKFAADGEKEEPIIRPSTSKPRSKLRAQLGTRRAKTAKTTR